MIKTLLLPVMVMFLFSGCYRDSEEFLVTGREGDISSFFNSVQTLHKTTSFNADQDFVIIEPDNSIVEIPANAFEDSQGNVVSNKLVYLDYLMLKDKGLLVMYDKPTISNGQLLETGGVFHFEAWNEERTEQYFLRDNYFLAVSSSSDEQVNGMKLFYGEGNTGEFNWNEVTSNWAEVTIDEWVFQDSTQIVDGVGYSFLVDELTWINCDVFNDIPDNQKTSACVEMPETYTNTNTAVFAIFTDIESVLGLQGSPTTKKFCDSYNAMPIGYNVTFITISALGSDVYYFGMKNALIQENHEEFITPEEKTLQEILDILAMF